MNGSALVVGGGFYGCMIALELTQYFHTVILAEAEGDILTRASYHNQARIHQGYHYPRSFTTAASSRRNYQQFIAEFPDCAYRKTPAYYAIAARNSNVTASDFEEVCARIGAPLSPAMGLMGAFDPLMIEQAYRVEEAAFDAAILRRIVRQRLEKSRVELLLNTRVTHLAPARNGHRAHLSDPDDTITMHASAVFVCTYANINRLLSNSRLPTVPLRHELTEMALVKGGEDVPNIALTVMDGPFFSLFPFPDKDALTLSHVAYTPHLSWMDDGSDSLPDGRRVLQSVPRSNQRKMILDSARYMPSLLGLEYLDSLWEIKTTLPRSEGNDGRPILFRECADNVYAVLGSKIDNINDIRAEIHHLYRESRNAKAS